MKSILTFAVAVAAVVGVALLMRDPGPDMGSMDHSSINTDSRGDLTSIAAATPDEHQHGRELFVRHCALCHGAAGEGAEQGPPLVHAIYEPRHHADAAFLLAVRNGVRAHHWGFGDMEPVAGVTPEQVEAMIGYVRWLQRQVGIE